MFLSYSLDWNFSSMELNFSRISLETLLDFLWMWPSPIGTALKTPE